jgi:hypothetical protein
MKTCLSCNRAQFSTRCVWTQTSNKIESDVSLNAHTTSKIIATISCSGHWEFYLRAWIRRRWARPSLSGNENSTRRSRRPGRRRAGSSVSGLSRWACQSAPRTRKVPIRSPIRSHQYFDISPGVKSIKLIDQLQHRPLHFVIPSSPIIEPGPSNRIHLVKENNASLLTPCHLKQFSYHTGAFPNILLHEFGTNDTDKSGISSIRYCTSAEGFPCTWGSKEEDTFWRINAKVYKTFRLKESSFKPLWNGRVIRTDRRGVSTTSRSFSICSLHPPTSEYVTSGFSSTCIIVTEASIFGGSGIWIWYFVRSTLYPQQC